MASNLYVGSSVVIRCTFRGWSDETDQGELEDPTSVVVEVVDSTDTVILTATPVRESFAVYSYQWTPSSDGEFVVRFVGTFADATPSTSVIPTEFNVTESPSSLVSDMSIALGEDEYIVLVGNLDPMFADYEEIRMHFPEADIPEIAELIYNYSVEAQELSGLTEATPLMQEFVLAAVACALTRMYDLFDTGDETAVALGDLSITKKPSSSGSSSKGLNRFTASTWCELAAVLREELLRGAGKTGLKAIVKGANVICPMPSRDLRPAEGRHWRSRYD